MSELFYKVNQVTITFFILLLHVFVYISGVHECAAYCLRTLFSHAHSYCHNFPSVLHSLQKLLQEMSFINCKDS